MSPENIPTFKHLASEIHSYLRGLFSLHADTDYDGTLTQVKANVEFKGGNLWALVLAILIASVGLNVNSTAVIIGAMLISPLMGPIIAAGLALGINDIELFRRAARNLAIAVGISILTSALYFSISPLAEVQSELLARTRPTIYDVLIAVFGGAVGAVALSRKGDKGNVLPGVAIATALMPPLCTAGFGLAQWNLHFFFGAIHLFLINALFIGLATLGIIRILRFRRIAYLDPQRAKRIRAIIAVITVATVIPSIYVGLNVIQETRFKAAARRYAAETLVFPDRTVINIESHYARAQSTITATILGQPLSPDEINSLELRLINYGLNKTRLILRQASGNQLQAEQISQSVRQGIIEDLFKRNAQLLAERDKHIKSLENELSQLRSSNFPIQDLSRELSSLFPSLKSICIGPAIDVNNPTSAPTIILTASWTKPPSPDEQKRIHNFIMARLKNDQINLINHVEVFSENKKRQ